MKLFDLDGTLIDSNGVWEQIDLAFLGRHGLVPTREYSDAMGRSIFPVAAQLTRDYYHLDLTPQAIMDEWMSMAWEAYSRHIPLKPGAAALLEQFRQAGEPMALVSACQPQLCQAVLARHGLEGYFQRLIFCQDMGLEKREPEVFLRSAALLGVLPNQCTMYEDSPSACAAAWTAGLEVVGVYDPFYDLYQEEMGRLCHRYVYSLEELLG